MYILSRVDFFNLHRNIWRQKAAADLRVERVPWCDMLRLWSCPLSLAVSARSLLTIKPSTVHTNSGHFP